MEALEAIAARRSIRRFTDESVSRKLVGKVLRAATLAPSGKNRQPWRFIVVDRPEDRAEMVRRMRVGIEAARQEGENLGSSEKTALIMEQAPVTVFVFNARLTDETEDSPMAVVDLQSVGAAVQNMCLAATALGLGSLWICDVFYAYEELREWLGRRDQMVCAVSLGWPDEDPGPRPRMRWEEVTTWLGD